MVSFTLPVFANDEQISKEELEQQLKDSQYKIDETKDTVESIQAEIASADAALGEIIAVMDEIDGQINDLDSKMAATREEIAQAEARKVQQEKELEERLRVMYMYGDEGYLEILFSAKNFTELLTRMEMVASVMTSDRDMVNALEKTKKEIESKNMDLEADKAELVDMKQVELDALSAQEAIRIQKEELLASSQNDLFTYEEEVKSGLELAKQLGYTDIQFGEYLWPFDIEGTKSFYITDDFGPRVSPGGFGSSYHEGLDIAPDYGTPILAIANGEVKSAGWDGSFGNAVSINHGVNSQGVSIGTISAHMSSIAVSAGEMVTKGQVIGYVGSTGASTGNHLHLGLLEDGKFVDPMPYFSQYADRMQYIY